MQNIASSGIAPIAIFGLLLLGGIGLYSNLVLRNADYIIDQNSTYLIVEDAMGKFESDTLDKLLLFIRPLFPRGVNLSTLSLQLSDKDSIFLYHYGGYSEEMKGEIFESNLWKELGKDEYGVFGRECDGIFCIAVNVSHLSLHPGDKLDVSIIPGRGVTTHAEIDIPLANSKIVHLNV